MSFLSQVSRLPRLGLGVSTEYGAGDTASALDPIALRERYPAYARFLEIGIEVAKGLDRHASAWVERGWPTTYRLLDVNLDEPEDFDDAWIAEVRAIAAWIRPSWMCGDAGLWHSGSRERGHMLLLPPVLSEDSARAAAAGIVRLRNASGLEVLPENPSGMVYLGDLHLLDYFARVIDLADTGMLLDCAHLAIYQRAKGHPPLTALDGFPLERVTELHVAGASESEVAGFRFLEDDHNVDVLPDTWQIFEHVVPRTPNLRAVVFECERNHLEACLPGFGRIAAMLAGTRLAEAVQAAHPGAEMHSGSGEPQ